MENLSSKSLRIGNIVRSKVNGISKVEQIGSSINSEYVGGRSLEGNYWENSYLPIEIDDDWLVRFGFINRPMSYDIELNEHTILQLSICNDKGKGEYYAMIRQEDEMISVPKRIFYVHELQNLFFAITGRELEMKRECECEYPIIRQDLTEYFSICQQEVK